MTSNIPFPRNDGTYSNLLNFYINQHRETINQINRLQTRLDFLNSSIANMYTNTSPITSPITNTTLNTPRRRPRRQRELPNPPSFQYTRNPIRDTTLTDDWRNILQTFFNNVPVAPTRRQIANATTSLQYSEIVNPINDSCPISLERFSNNEIVMQINECGHIFNAQELGMWFRNNVRCPVCRYDIRDNLEPDQEEPIQEQDIIQEPEIIQEPVVTNDLYRRNRRHDSVNRNLSFDFDFVNNENDYFMYDASNNILLFETTLQIPRQRQRQ